MPIEENRIEGGVDASKTELMFNEEHQNKQTAQDLGLADSSSAGTKDFSSVDSSSSSSSADASSKQELMFNEEHQNKETAKDLGLLEEGSAAPQEQKAKYEPPSITVALRKDLQKQDDSSKSAESDIQQDKEQSIDAQPQQIEGQEQQAEGNNEEQVDAEGEEGAKDKKGVVGRLGQWISNLVTPKKEDEAEADLEGEAGSGSGSDAATGAFIDGGEKQGQEATEGAEATDKPSGYTGLLRNKIADTIETGKSMVNAVLHPVEKFQSSEDAKPQEEDALAKAQRQFDESSQSSTKDQIDNAELQDQQKQQDFEATKQQDQANLDDAKVAASNQFEETKAAASEKIDQAKEVVKDKIGMKEDETVSELASRKFEEGKEVVKDKLDMGEDETVGELASRKYEEGKEVAAEKAQEFKAAASEKIDDSKEAITNKYQETKEAATEKFEETKEAASDKALNFKDAASKNIESVKEQAQEKFDDAKEAVSDKVEDVKENISADEDKSFAADQGDFTAEHPGTFENFGTNAHMEPSRDTIMYTAGVNDPLGKFYAAHPEEVPKHFEPAPTVVQQNSDETYSAEDSDSAKPGFVQGAKDFVNSKIEGGKTFVNEKIADFKAQDNESAPTKETSDADENVDANADAEVKPGFVQGAKDFVNSKIEGGKTFVSEKIQAGKTAIADRIEASVHKNEESAASEEGDFKQEGSDIEAQRQADDAEGSVVEGKGIKAKVGEKFQQVKDAGIKRVDALVSNLRGEQAEQSEQADQGEQQQQQDQPEQGEQFQKQGGQEEDLKADDSLKSDFANKDDADFKQQQDTDFKAEDKSELKETAPAPVPAPIEKDVKDESLDTAPVESTATTVPEFTIVNDAPKSTGGRKRRGKKNKKAKKAIVGHTEADTETVSKGDLNLNQDLDLNEGEQHTDDASEDDSAEQEQGLDQSQSLEQQALQQPTDAQLEAGLGFTEGSSYGKDTIDKAPGSEDFSTSQ